jgi:hypothetical protein
MLFRSISRRLTGFEEPGIHAIIVGYWHSIVTPLRVSARVVVAVVAEMRAKGLREGRRRLARRSSPRSEVAHGGAGRHADGIFEVLGGQ